MNPPSHGRNVTAGVMWGLSEVPDSSLSHRTVIPAKAGIQDILNPTTFWIPAFAGMTD